MSGGRDSAGSRRGGRRGASRVHPGKVRHSDQADADGEGQVPV